MNEPVYVWDRYVRIAHWTLAAAFFTAYLSGEEESLVHVYAGYLVGALVVSRVVWGVIGTRHARFTDFVRPPAAAIGYLRSLVGGAVVHYRGHNPAGGWMVIALLLGLGVTVATGLKVYGLEGEGPFAVAAVTDANPDTMSDDEVQSVRAAKKARKREEHFWEEVHETAANLTLGLVVLHVAGVVLSSLRHRENLVRAMVTGYKRSRDGETPTT